MEMINILPAIKGPRGRPRRKPKELYGDRGYGFDYIISLVKSRRITSKLARRGTEHESGLGQIRYVIERTMAWFGQNRRLKICYEKNGDMWQGYHELAECLICFRRWQKVLDGL